MAAVELTITGMLYDKLARTAQNVVLIGEATLTGLSVGGGPMPGGPPPHVEHPIPPVVGGGPIIPPGGGQPPWYPGHPEHPIPPAVGGGPIYPPNVPPELTPPQPPSPGDPTTVVPGSFPVQPITPPPYIVVNYPGIGPVTVAPPLTAQPKPA
jgi:hypothetical protein